MRKIRKVQCSGCGKFFVGDSIFDRHRTGEFGVDRRCFTTEEMIEKGFGSEACFVGIALEGTKSYQEKTVWFLIDNRESLLASLG